MSGVIILEINTFINLEINIFINIFKNCEHVSLLYGKFCVAS